MPIVAQHLYDQVAQDEQMRLMRFQRASKAYHGEFPQPLKVRFDQPNDNATINFARIVIDKGASFLFGKAIEFELDETADTDAEEWLEAAWRANKKQARLHNIALNGGVYGHCFVKIVPDVPYPRLVVLDPATVKTLWDTEDIEKVIRYVITYAALDPYTEKPINIRQLIERQPGARGDTWVITDQRNDPDGSDDAWTTVSVTDWPYAWEPIVHCQNLPAPNEFWGVSDLEDDLLGINQNVNFILSNLNRIIRIHAHPWKWGTGFDTTELKIGPDDTLILPDGATLQALEMQSDLGATIELYNRLREALHELARIPEVATGKLENIGALSGIALQILFAPLIEKTETKRSLYGELLIEINRRMLELGGFGHDNITEIHWPELLPSDPLAERQALQIDAALGVSEDTILTKLGYDPDLEREKKLAAQPVVAPSEYMES